MISGRSRKEFTTTTNSGGERGTDQTGTAETVQEKLARLVVALPVASPDAEATIRRMVDEWVCLQAPFGFMAVGSYYRDFTQVEDADVVLMLKESREKGERG